jgi:hypothetical protein
VARVKERKRPASWDASSVLELLVAGAKEPEVGVGTLGTSCGTVADAGCSRYRDKLASTTHFAMAERQNSCSTCADMNQDVDAC